MNSFAFVIVVWQITRIFFFSIGNCTVVVHEASLGSPVFKKGELQSCLNISAISPTALPISLLQEKERHRSSHLFAAFPELGHISKNSKG